MDFDAFTRKIKENEWDVHGVEVYENNQRIYEYGETSGVRFPIYSATKAITSLAVGMAADAGKLDIGRSVLCYMPENVVSGLPDRQKALFKEVTLERLLTMSVPGFPFRPEGESWLHTSLRYPVMPGQRAFNYNNVSAYLAGVAAAHALETDLYDFLCHRLFAPLGIDEPPCSRCPDGYFYGASGMELSVNELSRIGMLLMGRGVYRGQRIVSEAYLDAACSVRQMNWEGGYGYFIWKYRDGFSVNGKWGQKCYILPKQGIMVTFLAHMEENADRVRECMEEFLLGGAEGGSCLVD